MLLPDKSCDLSGASRDGGGGEEAGPIPQGLMGGCWLQRTAYLSNMRGRLPARPLQPATIWSPPPLSHEDGHMCLRSKLWQGYNFANQLGSFLMSGHKSADAQLHSTKTEDLVQDLFQKQLWEQIILASRSRF